MGKQVTLGGQRLGTGNKMTVNLHGYDRSTFNLSKVARTTMAPGTLVPVYCNIGENGDTFDIDIDELVKTLPTNGPLMGSFKLQIDCFTAPIRLYNGLLHNNAIGVGMEMKNIKFPKLKISQYLNKWNNVDKQMSSSSLMAYVGLRDLGKFVEVNRATQESANSMYREINALPVLAYYDIFKNYYSNKQEENCYIIKADQEKINGFKAIIARNGQYNYRPEELSISANNNLTGNISLKLNETTGFYVDIWGEEDNETLNMFNDRENIKLVFEYNNEYYYIPLNDGENGFTSVRYEKPSEAYEENPYNGYPTLKDKKMIHISATPSGKIPTIDDTGGIDNQIPLNSNFIFRGVFYESRGTYRNTTSLKAFPLEDFDDIREYILKNSEKGLSPRLPLDKEVFKTLTGVTNGGLSFNHFAQNGLMVKTYLSDIFNNWLNSEMIDGANGIANISKVSTADGGFTIDALNLAQKVYNLLNRIAVSGGTYNDWQESVFDVETVGQAETPIYYGGLSADINFAEVVSTADTSGTSAGNQPLGSLGGRGVSNNRNDGKVIIKITEPSVIMVIASITPRIDYSQGNKWYLTELDNMDDLHKPALDGIGFQDLMLERMVGKGTIMERVGSSTQWAKANEQLSIGKQPAWIEYQTDYNECFGDFAEENKAMYMTLNRRYNVNQNGDVTDITTYIDPSKYNYAFADTAIEAQNFWLQVKFDIEARRKMSAKIIPNI